MSKGNHKRVLTKSDLLSGSSLKIAEFEMPGGESVILLRELSAKQLLKYNTMIRELQEKSGPEKTIGSDGSLLLVTLLISMSAIDEEGRPLFADQEEVAGIGENSMTLLNSIATEIMKISGISVDDAKVLEDVEDLKKVPSGSSIYT